MVFEKVQALLADQLNIEKDKVTTESNIINDLGADSLDVVEMLMTLEEEYSISVPDDVAMELKTVGDIVKYVEEHK